jgi:hypothetical protein
MSCISNYNPVVCNFQQFREISIKFILFFWQNLLPIILCQNISHRYSISVPLGIPWPSRFSHHPDQLTSRLGYAGRRLALFESKCSMDANIAARFVYRRIQSPVWTARVPARACGPVGAPSHLRRSLQAFFPSGRHAECCTRLFLAFSQREWKAAPRRWYPHLVRRLLLISFLFSIPTLSRIIFSSWKTSSVWRDI